MNERPILFSGPMVQAILAGTKTQTRRVVKNPYTAAIHAADSKNVPWVSDRPYGEAGDRLWVRETWKPWPNTAGPEFRGPDDMGAIYAATWDKSGGYGWKPSIHMPRWASRLLLEVVSVRVERVQDIGEADARAEGVDHIPAAPAALTHRAAFSGLWNSINSGRGYSWTVNPWVWVVEFRRAPHAD